MKLEQFIKDNKEAFDSFEPSQELWSKIESKMPRFDVQTKQPETLLGRVISFLPSQKYWSVAAGFVLVLGLGFWLGQRGSIANSTKQISEVNPQVGQMAVQYVSMIETKREEISLLKTQDPELFKRFEAELVELEQNYQNLKTALPQSPNQEITIEAMVQNLQQQIDLLNTQLSIIQRIKTYKKDHEKQKSNPAFI